MEIAFISIVFAVLALAVAVVPLLVAVRLQARADASAAVPEVGAVNENAADLRVRELVS